MLQSKAKYINLYLSRQGKTCAILLGFIDPAYHKTIHYGTFFARKVHKTREEDTLGHA